ncbi:MAG: hypothetical protein QM650_09970 [Microlunatus sp.]
MQSAAGNRATSRLLLQRTASRPRPVQRCGPVPHDVCPCNEDNDLDAPVQRNPTALGPSEQTSTTPRAPTPAPIRSKLEESEIKDIEDFSAYSVGERLGFVVRLHQERWVGPGDESALKRIWRSFGEKLPQIAGDHIALFNASIDYGAELDDLPVVVRYRRAFEADVKGTAARFLSDNRGYVTQQLEQLGLSPDGPTGTTDDAKLRRADALAEIREHAKIIARAQQAQRQLRTLQVGWEVDYEERPRGGWRRIGPFPSMFDPAARPMQEPRGTEQPPLPKWDDVNARYLPLSDLIVGITNADPAVYAAMRDEKLGALAGEDPQTVLKVVEKSLQAVLADINATGPKISSDDLDYRDLVPIHQQLFGGITRGPSQTDWSTPFGKSIGTKVLADHQASEFWIALGLGSLAAAAFIVAELATFGSATFFLAAGVGLGAGALQAGRSWEKYFDMATAARATVRDDRSVLSQGQASGALLAAVLDTAFLFLDAYQVGAKGARAAASAAERAASKEAAEQAEREVAALARREAAEITQAAEQRAGAAAGRQAAEATGSTVLHEAPVQIGKGGHRLKVIDVAGRLTLWLCSDCLVLIGRVQEILERMPATHPARDELTKILAAAQTWQSRFTSTAKGTAIGEARLVRETNDLASRLSQLSAQHADIEGLVFFRTFLAGSEEAATIIGEDVARRLTAELGQDGFVQLVRDLGPATVSTLGQMTGTEMRQLMAKHGRDAIRWVGDSGLNATRARTLLSELPESMLTRFREGRAKVSATVVEEALNQFGSSTLVELGKMLGDKFTGKVLDEFRRWTMFSIDPTLQRLVAGGRGATVRGLPDLSGRTLADIEGILMHEGMRQPLTPRGGGMHIWTHADGSVVRIKVGSKALKGESTTFPHLVKEIAEKPGRFGSKDIIAKVTEGAQLIPAGTKAASSGLSDWFKGLIGRTPTDAELKFLMGLWGASGHLPIVR